MENTDLSAALETIARGDTSAARRRVYETLLDSTLLVPLAEGRRAADGSPRLDLVATASSRQPALLAFSDERALALWGSAARTALATAAEVFAAALGKGLRLTLNPAGPVSVTLARWELRRLAEGRPPDPEEAAAGEAEDARTTLGPPSLPLGDRFEGELRERLARHPAVAEGYVFEADPMGGQRQLVVGLLVEEGSAHAAMPALIDDLHEVLAPAAPPEAVVNYTLVRDDAKLAALRERVKPLYRRTAGG